MSSHTPGPWAVHPRFPEDVVVAADVDKGIGGSVDPDREAELYAKQIHRGSAQTQFSEFHRSRITSAEEVRANARLIAAAPDLLDALRDLLAMITTDDLVPSSVSYMKQARAAIAKAVGDR